VFINYSILSIFFLEERIGKPIIDNIFKDYDMSISDLHAKVGVANQTIAPLVQVSKLQHFGATKTV
jgi:hypothetical protein